MCSPLVHDTGAFMSTRIHPELSHPIRAAAIEVHRQLGPGLLESAYESCLAIELQARGIPFERQVPLPIPYRGQLVDNAYRMDWVVAGKIVLEIKSVAKVHPIHKAQLHTDVRLSRCRVGFLMTTTSFGSSTA